ncbi:PREDICTED: AT-hook motif nuclear-localized protein 10 isoform X2 [Tarenaya hassleriana]|nr:PREDICTED: AT-hook motif nuclear-localized protein 10 isoform X2 [Tarenaya hassleriana]XP_019056674.1 PREDICTED: AT-hook motif nuclear-localized protein 10 isoform X2 [Tarenaya hassleriana]
MSGSETGMISSREPVPFTMDLQNNPAPAQPVIQNMRLNFIPDGVSGYKPASPPQYQPNSSTGAGEDMPSANHGFNMNMVGSEPVKRKRGRPRKYGPDSGMSLALVPGAVSCPSGRSAGDGGLPSPPAASSGGATTPMFKKARGRPPGSGKKHQLQALGSTGLGFTPHVINVKAGEDVSSKIMAFSQHGPRAVCVLSANGSISNVTLRQPATSGGTVTYEGRFEILSLSGSFLLMENGGHRSRTGGLSVSLSGPDGRVLGGCVAGLLVAASPVQVVVGSFISDGRKEPKRVSQSTALAMMGPSSPQSRGTMSGSSGGEPGRPPLNHTAGACNISGVPNMAWK